MADRKDSFLAGATKFDHLKKPKTLGEVSESDVIEVGVSTGFTRDIESPKLKQKKQESPYRAPQKRLGEKRISVALTKDDFRWLSVHAIDNERSIQNLLEGLVIQYRKKNEH